MLPELFEIRKQVTFVRRPCPRQIDKSVSVGINQFDGISSVNGE